MCWDGTGASHRTRRPAFPLGSARDRCSDLEKRVLLWLLGLPSLLSGSALWPSVHRASFLLLLQLLCRRK